MISCAGANARFWIPYTLVAILSANAAPEPLPTLGLHEHGVAVVLARLEVEPGVEEAADDCVAPMFRRRDDEFAQRSVGAVEPAFGDPLLGAAHEAGERRRIGRHDVPSLRICDG
ncbi:MAG: hypothetical protein HY736_17665 [Verrucomicrobia bacterium]|nr:hypothetical protein [Verrucomicrobiota bacterium]